MYNYLFITIRQLLLLLAARNAAPMQCAMRYTVTNQRNVRLRRCDAMPQCRDAAIQRQHQAKVIANAKHQQPTQCVLPRRTNMMHNHCCLRERHEDRRFTLIQGQPLLASRSWSCHEVDSFSYANPLWRCNLKKFLGMRASHCSHCCLLFDGGCHEDS